MGGATILNGTMKACSGASWDPAVSPSLVLPPASEFSAGRALAPLLLRALAPSPALRPGARRFQFAGGS